MQYNVTPLVGSKMINDDRIDNKVYRRSAETAACMLTAKYVKGEMNTSLSNNIVIVNGFAFTAYPHHGDTLTIFDY